MTTILERTDLPLQEEIAAQLSWDPRFLPAEIGVEVDRAVVTFVRG